MKTNPPLGQELSAQLAALSARRKLAVGLVVLASLLTLALVREPLLELFGQREAARGWVLSFGALAPLAYITLYVVQIILPPLPGHLMGLMGGYLFGAVWGSLYTLLGVALGAAIAVGAARHLGRPVILRLAGEQPVNEWERRLRVRSPLMWGVLFFFPVPDLLYYIAGLSGAPLRPLFVAALVGRAPGLIAANWVGTQAIDSSPWLIWTLVVLLAVAVMVVYRYQRQFRLLALMTVRQGHRLTRKYSGRG